MRSVKKLFSLTLTTLSLLFLASGCGGSSATTSKIKIMDADKTTVLIESFELKASETYEAFHTRISASAKIKALKLGDKTAIANNTKIHAEIQKFLNDKTPAVTELGHKHLYRLKTSDALVSDPSKLKDKDELYIQIYVDYDDHLEGANLSNKDLTGANLTLADLTDADLTDADLTDADLTDANLTLADLTLADLTGANLTGANLTGADLFQATLIGVTLTDANFTNANLTIAVVASLSVFDDVKAGTITQTQKDSVDDQSAP